MRSGANSVIGRPSAQRAFVMQSAWSGRIRLVRHTHVNTHVRVVGLRGVRHRETIATYRGTELVEVVTMIAHTVQLFKRGRLLQTKIHAIVFVECCVCAVHMLANLA